MKRVTDDLKTRVCLFSFGGYLVRIYGIVAKSNLNSYDLFIIKESNTFSTTYVKTTGQLLNWVLLAMEILV